ncbi:MAG: cell surface protein SprA [Flavipsychrobacter sp.]|nr:cell surface protein SprA [Flavipsychrobacter sp.]
MKDKGNFGYKFLLFIALVFAIAHTAARGGGGGFFFDFADPEDSTTTNAKKKDSAKLKFPIKDKTGDPKSDAQPAGMDLKDPSNVKNSWDYDPETGTYNYNSRVGDEFMRNPTYMSFDEYQKYRAQQDEQAYWKRRLDALSLFGQKPTLPKMEREGLFDRIFGGNSITVKPQGNVDITLGGNWQNVQNPTLIQSAQKYGVFDFDMQMNINLLATVGDKLKLNISNNTKATFDYLNTQKLEYTGKEDEIIKKIEAGNISFPLKSSLISGVQSLFGIKTQLQFGRLWVTGVLSQQKSKRQSLTIQGGSQSQQFSIKADEYEENKHFLLSQYFRNNYNGALRNYPIINSLVAINKIEVWVTNRTGATEGVRNIMAYMDLGEREPFNTTLTDPTKPAYPDNRSNTLYDQLLQMPTSRMQGQANNAALSLGLQSGRDFEPTTARKLNPSEFTFNPALGYVSLNTQLNPDDVLAVAFRYTVNGKVFQVGEFAEDLPPDSTNTKVMFMKLLKGTSARPTLPIWDLMMKNVYTLGGLGVSKDDFRLNILYQDPGGGEKRYIPDGPNAGIPLLTLLNLDRLNFQNDPYPDGIFDFVDGITINTQQGKIIFPVLEPFGNDLLDAIGNSQQLARRYLYGILYDSTKTIARQFQQNNRYVIRGSYKSASSSEIFLGGFNIPQGSVTVSAGGAKLVENQDYQIDYGLGKIKILNSGILNSGIPINVAYEDNATFGFQQQNFTGLRLDYYLNEKLALGGTYMKLTERPFTQKVMFGEDPIRNTVLGLDANYQSEFAGLTRALDKLPIYSTTAPSFINATGEVATLRPGHAKQINVLDPEGSINIDDFEGTRSAYDLKFPANSWTLASTPFGLHDRSGNPMFPEAGMGEKLQYGMNRAKLAWYFIEPSLIDGGGSGVPNSVKNDPNQHYIRLVQTQEVFPNKQTANLQNIQSTLDLGFYPKDRGPYNFDAVGLDADGKLTNPQGRWGGIQKPIDYSDFEASNVEFIELWMMDPFINNPNSAGGSFYINLGNVSEDVLKDSRNFFENGIPYPEDGTKLDKTVWGNVPKFQQQITRAFDNNLDARAVQDVGYDGATDDEERVFFQQYLNDISGNAVAFQRAQEDPAGDNFRFYRDQFYDDNGIGILGRYKDFNGPHGNSPIAEGNLNQSATNIPESEDINRDNTLNETESYYSYRLDLRPNMQVGTNFIVDKQVSLVKLPNGSFEDETWYQFKIPIGEYQERVGGIGDFRSIRFVRMFLSDFQDSAIVRLAKVELGRNQWRRYLFSLKNPGENIPEEELKNQEFTVTSVSVEENGRRQPIPYVLPPGVNRQLQQVTSGQATQQNEQSLALQICGLKDGDSRAVFKEFGVDMRQFAKVRMFIHAESRPGQTVIKDGDVRAIIRFGSDFVNNYYEYQVPLKITPDGTNDPEVIWPEGNRLDLVLDDLVKVKTSRNEQGLAAFIPYQEKDELGNTIIVVGNPNLGDVKTVMLGVSNPKKTNQTPEDDGFPKCTEVWFNEMRMVGFNEKPGYAAAGKVSLQLADFGNINLAGSMHTQGYGNIDQKIDQRFRDNFYQYNASTNLNLGKLMPAKWGVQLPFFIGYAENISNPQYNPYDLDVKYQDQLNAAQDAAQRDSLRKQAQDYTSVTSVNVSNARITGDPQKQSAKTMPWSAKNFDVSYAYNKQFKRNPTIERDELVNNRFGLGYTYGIKSKSIEPFKRLIKSKSKWFGLVKDFNFNPLPANFTFRTDVNRTFNETKVRDLDDGPYEIEPTFFKNFLWDRMYTMRWELTRSLSFDYSANNKSRVDEPYGRVNTPEKRDSLWNRISQFGRNTFYAQTFNASYNLPLTKLPLTDWTSLRLQYSANYSWTAASTLARNLGNTINNTQTKQANGELKFVDLYNKNRWLKAANQPRPRSKPGVDKNNNRPGSKDSREDTKPGSNKNEVKDLRGGSNAQQGNNKNNTTDKPKSLMEIQKQAREDSLLKIQMAKMSDRELDSFRKVQKSIEEAKAKAEKEKKKRERKAARKARRNTMPQMNPAVKAGLRLVTMLKRVTVNYTENAGTILPGYMDSTTNLGVNMSNNLQPGLDFVYGYQPTQLWLEQQAEKGLLSKDSIFNAQFQQQYSQNFNIAATLEPFQDFRVDLTLTSNFSKSHNELYKYLADSNARYYHLNPYETGSFTVSYIGINTIFKSGGANSALYNTFLNNRETVSDRLGRSNPYTNNTPDPNNPAYAKGYTEYSQDVLIPSFISAYGGRNVNDAPLIDYNSQNNIRKNPFKDYFPMPNWRVSYTGLSKLPVFQPIMSNLVVNHAYTGTMSMNSFVTSLFFQDRYNLGFPSFIDSNSGNYVPFFQVPNITISEAFSPLIGVDAAFRNNVTAKFEFNKRRTISLSLVDYQVSETNSTEYTIGAGYRIKGLVLPFEILGVKKLKNDMTIRVDVAVRDDRTTNNFLAQNIGITTRGQRVIRISPTIDYVVSEKLTLRLFFDRNQSIPYVSSSFPITTTRGGLMLRFIFAN